MNLARWWRSRIAWTVMAVAVVAALAIGARSSPGPERSAQRVNRLASQIRCPGCTDLSAAESSAPSAVAVRRFIGNQVSAGRSDQAIDSFLVSRYGSGILLQPPTNGVGAALWLIPIGGGIFLVAILAAVAYRRRREHTDHGDLVPVTAPEPPPPAPAPVTGARPMVAEGGVARRRLDRGPRRNALGVAGLVSLVVAGVLVVGWRPGGHPAETTSGRATAATPGPPAAGSEQEVAEEMVRAQRLVSSEQYAQALQLLDQVLRRQPDLPQALAYRGWILRLTGVAAHRPGLVRQGRASVAIAVAEDPSYPDARAFLGYMLFQDDHDPAGAVTQFRAFLADDPLPEMVDLTHTVVTQAFAAVGQAVPPAGTAPLASTQR